MSDKKRILIPRIPLNNNVYADIHLAINEEYGIRDCVVDEAISLSREIIHRLSSADTINVWNNYTGKIISYKQSLFDEEYTINVTCTYFDTWEEFRESEEYVRYDCYSDIDKNVLSLVTTHIRDTFPFNYFDDPIQHELSHIYQHTQGGCVTTKHILPLELYKQCCNVINTCRQLDPYVIARGVYSCYSGEQDAYINGLDAIYRNAKVSDNKDVLLKESPAYKALDDIKSAIALLDRFPEGLLIRYLQDIKKTYRVNKELIRKILMTGQKELTRKIGRVIVKNNKLPDNGTYTNFSRRKF